MAYLCWVLLLPWAELGPAAAEAESCYIKLLMMSSLWMSLYNDTGQGTDWIS